MNEPCRKTEARCSLWHAHLTSHFSLLRSLGGIENDLRSQDESEEDFFYSASHHSVHFCVYLKINLWPLVIVPSQSRTQLPLRLFLLSVVLTQRWFWLVRVDELWGSQEYQVSFLLSIWPKWTKCVFVNVCLNFKINYKLSDSFSPRL